MDLDNLNNSQLILLVLLVTLVSSAAISVATIAILYDRLPAIGDDTAVQPTVIRQTVNRIIEREKVEQASEPQIVGENSVTLGDIEGSFRRVYLGSQPVTVGFFISGDGMLVAADSLNAERRYGIRNGDEVIPFTPVRKDGFYTLLMPESVFTPEYYIPLDYAPNPMLGQSALIYGGFGDDVRLHSEVVSQKRVDEDGVRVRTSADRGGAFIPSAVLIDTVFVGFITEESGWVRVVGEGLLKGTDE